MDKKITAIGFYPQPSTASSVLNGLFEHGCLRCTSIHKTSEGKIEINRLSTWFLIDKPKLEHFKQVLLPDETLVVAQISEPNVRSILNIMRNVPSGHPVCFLLRPNVYELCAKAEDLPIEPLNLEQLEDNAIKLAGSLRDVKLKRQLGRPMLRQFKKCAQVLQDIRNIVVEAEHLEQTINLSAEWMLDNTHVIQGNVEEVLKNLPSKFYRDLPKLTEGPWKGFPRIYVLAHEMVKGTANHLTYENIIAYLKSYQTVDKLTIGELWAFPLILRLRLIECMQTLSCHIERRIREGELAGFWGNRLLNISRKFPDQLPSFLKELATEVPQPSPHFAEELLDHLFDDVSALPDVTKWLDDKLSKNAQEILHLEQKQKTIEQVAFSNAIISIIHLSQFSWREIFEAVSPVDAILKDDPSNVYNDMDFNTKDSYRHSIEIVSRGAKDSEVNIANTILQFALQGKDEVTRHVGYYLIDDGRPVLEKAVGYSPTLLQRIRRWLNLHPSTSYFSSIGLLTLAIEILVFFLSLNFGAGFAQTWIFTLLALIPASEISIQLLNFLYTNILPPHVLPKMSFKQGIPEENKSLVVIPVKILNADNIDHSIKRLEIHYLANPDPHLRFGLFIDLFDAPQQVMANDAALINAAVKGMQSLNEKYGEDKFYLFNRPREWSNSESAWIGQERKRGKLESLNEFLLNAGKSEAVLLVGKKDRLKNMRFVITLDLDTQLPKDKAKELIETISHPLNLPRLSSDNTVLRGYTIIQPRVNADFSQARLTLFSQIFADASTIDPYTQAVSDVYQDLMKEGTYHGKGIYDLNAFHTVLANRFPKDTLLSHDLIEGAYARVGFASNIALIDQFPQDYLSWSRRQHRWIRGDWQIIDWLFPKVPTGSKKKQANTLSWYSRWKIFDNLRRSLLPILVLVLLISSWLFSSTASLWTIVAGIVLFLPVITAAAYYLFSLPKLFTMTFSQLGSGFLRSLINIVFLPHQAYLSADAIIRVFYRRLTHRHLLEWDTAHNSTSNYHNKFIIRLSTVSIFALIAFGIIYLHHVHNIIVAWPFCLLWFLTPLIAYFLDSKKLLKKAFIELSDHDRVFIKKVARKTWRYFDDFVGPQSHWLPPDNYQTALMIEVAQRTSSTNIGLWMLSVVSAYDLKFIVLDDALDRLQNTLKTLQKLELHEGHLLNWYDTQTLKPLYPRYVSTVDSGNFLASTWALEQSLYEMVNAPLLPDTVMEGLQTSFELLYDEMSHLQAKLTPLKKLIYSKPQDLAEAAGCILKSQAALKDFISQENHGLLQKFYWLGNLEKELDQWALVINRYFEWVDILENMPSLGTSSDEKARGFKNQILKLYYSLTSLFAKPIGPFSSLLDLFKSSGQPNCKAWADQLDAALQKAKWLAGEKLGQSKDIFTELHKISESMNMRFLYNEDRKLFSIGYLVDDCRLDTSFYDLLASEARIASLISIAKGDVPVEHWWALGRPYRYVFKKQVLVSWGGTMFEYLMPLLFTKNYENSLLSNACINAVACQQIYGQRRGIPWGISEAAYSEIDARKTYQYRSFGVPGLGFKRDLDEDLVVSPYSTMLALAVDPHSAVKNMHALSTGKLNVLSTHGFYESIDYTRQKGPHGERGVIVHAFFAHHQGMSFIAINNLLNGNIFNNRMHADPRIAGVESLLYESTPYHPLQAKGIRKALPVPRLFPFTITPIMGVVNTPHTATPKVNLLSNGDYSIMTTNSGGGYSRWRDIDITRWRSDTTCDCWGNYFYIKDVESGHFWSSAFSPTQVKPTLYSVNFKADKVEFKRRDDQIETLTEKVVSPEDNAEIHLLTLANLSKKTCKLELTSYFELALAPHEADLVHPCFNKFFIQIEPLPDMSALLASRRLRSSDEKQIWSVHLVTANQTFHEPVQFETDREKFIGRGKSLKHPQAINGDLSNYTGSSLDPIFSLRRSITIEPGQRVQVSFITGVADTRDGAIALIQKYTGIDSIHRAIEMAWTHAQLELRHLRIHQEESQIFQKMASLILFPHSHLRPAVDKLIQNTQGQATLWKYGISGDLPIVVVTVADRHELEIVKQVLTAHAFWRLRGLKVDLVIFNDEVSSYESPLDDSIHKIVHSQASHGSEIGKPGGIFPINCDQIPKEDKILIQAVARISLIAARGYLRQQLVSPRQEVNFPSRLSINKKATEKQSKPLPFLELPYFNGLGGYTKDGREYVIYLGPNTYTPAPWINVISNPHLGVIVSESGLGMTWYGNSQTNRLTAWSNDPLLNPVSDAIYIRDDETGNFWSPTPEPVRELDAYRIRHGQGYTRFEHNSHGIEQDLLIFVPVNDSDGHPLRIQKLTLKNGSSGRRTLSVIGYSEWVLGKEREHTQMHVITKWDPESQAIFAINRYNADFGSYVAFTFCTPMAKSYTANRTEFIGRNHHASSPAALKRQSLSGMAGAAMDPCSALQVELTLEPNESKEVIFIMGYAANHEQARNMIVQYREAGWADKVFSETCEWWNKTLNSVQVDVPELNINFAMNRWLLYQVLSCRVWARSAFYQSSGAYGFRDQLQDVLALLYAAPHIAREHIIKTASRQFVEGDVQHWWHPPSNGGIRTQISDDMLWLPFVTAHYVRVTKDISILEEKIPFIKGDPLKEGQHESYFVPTTSEESAPLLEHCRRAIQKGLTSGPHGLPLIGSGDWNDGLNRVGINGKGESVWLAWFLCHVMNDFAEMLAEVGQHGAGDGFIAQAKRLAEIIDRTSWDGEWYLRAFFDDGTPLGSKSNEEAFIDSISQSWAVISGAGTPDKTSSAMESVSKHLVKNEDGLVLLLTPPFDRSSVDPGYIKGYPPGVRENGGQYTHGSLWVPMAYSRQGDGGKAVNLLLMMHPTWHTPNPEKVNQYKGEPYVLAGDVYSLAGHVGRSGWTWYSGSAGWMYRIWLEEILGFQKRGDKLAFKPVLPPKWEKIGIQYIYKSSTYSIRVENPQHLSKGKIQIEFDGQQQVENEIPLVDDGKTHQVLVRFVQAN